MIPITLPINSHGLNLTQSPTSQFSSHDKTHTSKLIVNGHAIDIKSKEDALPPYLKELLKKNETLNYDNILLKVQSGEDLSSAELAAIREKDPELYEQLLREIRFQKQFEKQLKKCKTKKEAQELYLNTQLTVAKMCGARSGSSSIPEGNLEKYNRMINRIHKSYQKYASGKLDEPAKEDTTPTTSSIYDASKQPLTKYRQNKKTKPYDERA